jgi:hypothetical protein
MGPDKRLDHKKDISDQRNTEHPSNARFYVDRILPRRFVSNDPMHIRGLQLVMAYFEKKGLSAEPINDMVPVSLLKSGYSIARAKGPL